MSSRVFKQFRQIVAVALGCVAGFVGTADIQVVSLQGESIGEGLTFESYSAPSLNKYGEIAFAANMEEFNTGDSSRFESVLFFNGSGLHLLAATDQVAPKPGTDGEFEFFDAPQISELGIAFYRAKPRGSQWAVNERGIWMSWLVNDPEGAYPQTDILARIWDRANIDFLGNESEEGGRYDLLSNPIVVEPRTFAFVGDLYEGAYEGVSGIWYQDARGSETWNIPEPSLLALTSLPLPGSSLVLDKIEAYAPIDTTGGFALARIEQGNGVSSGNDLGLWRVGFETNATILLRSGDIDTTTGEPIASIGNPSANAAGQGTVWVEILDENASESVYLISNNTAQSVFSSNAPIAIGEESLEIDSIFNPVINEQGDIAFLTTLVSADSSPDYALFLRKTNGTLELLAKTGDQATGAFEGTVYETINSPRLNDSGSIAFLATLGGDGAAISDTTDSGIWAHDEQGILTLVSREGDTIEARSDEFRTLSAFEIGGFNDDNEMALKLMFTNGDSAIALASVEPAAPPVIAVQPVSFDTYLGEQAVLEVVATGQGPFLYQWHLNGEDIAGAIGSTLTISEADPANAGDYSVTVISPAGEVVSSFASLGVLSLPAIPVLVEEPLGDIALLGESATLTSRAVADSIVSYQWYKDGQLIDGATGATLWISQAAVADEGSYHVLATTLSGSVQSATAEILVTDKRLINISTRAHVGTGANVLIAGFAISGSENKTVLIRAVGPGLEQFGLDGFLANPHLSLNGASGVIAENSGWTSQPNQAEIAQAAQTVGAFSLPTDSEDAMMLVELEPGAYTAIVSGENNSTGIALVEVYEVGSNFARLVNISSRAHVATDSGIVISGVVVDGDFPSTILARAIGPSLEQFGLDGVLENPVLEVLNAAGEVIATNDGWNGNSSISQAGTTVGAFPVDSNSRDAALIIQLDPGLYTLKISGEDGTTGVALVELYAMP